MAKGSNAQRSAVGAGDSIPGVNPRHLNAGFTEAIPGMSAAPVPAQERVRKAQRELDKREENRDVHKEFNELSRTMRVVNRGMKGPMKGRAFLGVANGEQWPENVDADDESTWLQCGEFMDVPKDVAFILFGNLWDPRRPDRTDIIRKYGNHPFTPPPDEKVSGMAPMTPQGCPPIHDLVIYEIDSRGRKSGDFRFLYDIHCRDYGKFYERDLTDLADAETAGELDAESGEVRLDPRTSEVKEIIVASA